MMTERELALRILSCIDHTSLNGTDNDESIEFFCRGAKSMVVEGKHVASVCVYPMQVGVAVAELKNSDIKVAAVAGAFPHGQLPLKLKMAEVKYAVECGADEVDMVLNRGMLLQGKYAETIDEVIEMRKSCGKQVLKVILETGELPTLEMIRKASEIAIIGGANFIKTSTGKIATGATPEAVEQMLKVVKASGKNVGLKVAGGVRTIEQAMVYARQAIAIMGEDYLHPKTFRIGTSSLTPKIVSWLGAM